MFLTDREVNLVTLPNVIKHCEPLRRTSSTGGGGGLLYILQKRQETGGKCARLHFLENSGTRRYSRKSLEMETGLGPESCWTPLCRRAT
jgi:hypothetical protein